MRAKNIDDLNRIYSRAEECDRELFSEQRSNILLIAGEHYQKINNRYANAVRSSNKTPQSGSEQKLRLTKNHIHRLHRSYVTAILSEAPGTTVVPQRDTDLQDKKDAELCLSVWQDLKSTHKIHERRKEWCSQYVGIGEVCTKIFWDNDAGEFLGYEPKVDEYGQPTGEMDETKPHFSGDIVFEDVFGFNLLRENGTQEMHEHGRAWIVRKMVDLDELKQVIDDPEVINKLHESPDETYIVFDVNKASYEKKNGQILVREFYWEPCPLYPEGYFFYATKEVILAEGPLPGGIFPLVWAGFDKFPTSARGRSIIKVARPYQAEINRASSQMAIAQVTLGDDKVLYQAGSKLAPGALLPGVRGIAYQGATPTVLPGRNGAQYMDYVNAQVAELNQVTMMEDTEVLDKSGQVEAYTMLYRAASRKRKYAPYIENFENFEIEVTHKALEIARAYYPDDKLIPAIGMREAVNIPEFRSTSPLNTLIKVENQSETLETQFGKQLTFQHILQYVGNNLDKRTMGKILKNLPFANYKDSFDDLTLDEDVATNDMLALERGEPVVPTPHVEPSFMLRKLTARQKAPDFKLLAPPVQQAYQILVQQYEQLEAANQEKILAAKNEYIPVDGALVTCDFYVPPKNPEEQAKRAKVPQRALEWLIQRLQEQGMSLEKIQGMNSQNLADMADMILSNKARQGAVGTPPPNGPPMMAG